MAELRVLIVEDEAELAAIWARFLERQGLRCRIALAAQEAVDALRDHAFDAVVLDVELTGGGALEVADFAAYRQPDMPVIAVTRDGFFSGGEVFELMPNARGLLHAPLKLEDMAALISHYGGRYAGSAPSER